MTENVPATTQRGGLPATGDDNYNPFADAAKDMGGSEGSFAKFNGKSGEYVHGQDDEVLFDEDMKNDGEVVEMAINMLDAKRGWMCWIDGDVKDERMVKIVDGHPPREVDLPDYSDPDTKDYEPDFDPKEDGWVECIELPMRSITTGDQYLFKGSSKGTLKTFKSLLKDYGRQFNRHDLDEEVAIVQLDLDSYDHPKKQYGKIYNPILKLVRWMDIADIEASMENDGYEDSGEPAKAEKPKKKEQKAKPSDDPDNYEDGEEAPEEKPKTRRRRSF